MDFGGLLNYFSNVYKLYSPTKLRNALLAICRERLYHPIKEYFNSLSTWAGVERVDTLLIDYLGAEDSPYIRAVTRTTLIAAVDRIYDLELSLICITHKLIPDCFIIL